MDLLEVTRDQEARIQILESSAERSAQARRDRRSNLYGNIGAIAAITSAIAALIALLSRAA